VHQQQGSETNVNDQRLQLLLPPPARQGNRQIDPAFVMQLSNLAIRLESITAGTVLNKNATEPKLYARMSRPSGLADIENNSMINNNSHYSQAFNKRMQEVASDEELLMLMENFVTRIEVRR
jgi:adenylate cyclase